MGRRPAPSVLWSPGLGLNGAVDAGRATIAGKGFDHVVVAHSDLPLAHDLAALAVRAHDHARARPPARRHERARRRRSTSRSSASYGGGVVRAPPRRWRSPTGYRVEVRADPAARRSTSTRPPTSPTPRCARTCRHGCERSWTTDAEQRRRRAGATATVDLDVPASALAIGAHPDDVEFGAGGTLAKWAAAGCVVHHLVCTDGSKGTWDVDADTVALVARRQDEQREAARRIAGGRTTGEVAFLGRVDGELANDRRHASARSSASIRDAAARGRARPRPVEALPAAPRPPPRRLARLRRHRRRPRSALLPRPRPRPLTGRRALMLFEADAPNHAEDVTRLRRRASWPRCVAHESQFESTMHAAERRPGAARGASARGSARRLAELGEPWGLPLRRGRSRSWSICETGNWPAARPSPGGPANAWAMAIHCVGRRHRRRRGRRRRR